MNIRSILEDKGRSVVTIAADQTVEEAAKVLSNNRIGAVIVLSDAGELLGILSERDVVRAISRFGAEGLGRSARSVMTSDVARCHEHDSLDGTLVVMTERRFRHMPVEESGELVGIVSIGDVVKRKIRNAEREAKHLRDYISS